MKVFLLKVPEKGDQNKNPKPTLAKMIKTIKVKTQPQRNL